MTASEWQTWMAYRLKHGPMNPVLRNDAVMSLAIATGLNAAGRKKQGGGHFDPSDFMPYVTKPALTPETAMAALTKGKR